MTILSDYAGSWDFKGIITPRFDQWVQVPGAINSGSSLVRLTCYGDLNLVKSFGYIRSVFDVGTELETQWKRFYFSSKRSISINLNLPEELLMNADVCPRFLEIKKDLFWRYRKYGTVVDYEWTVAVEVLYQASLPPSVLGALQGSPAKVLNVGNSGNIIVVLESQEIP